MHELGRPGLGRQRDLAGARRRRAVGGCSRWPTPSCCRRSTRRSSPMLLGLVFRGVAFEFRWRTERGKFLWDWAFAGGSTLAAFAQGIALGALVQGIPVSRPRLCRRLVGLADAVQPAHRRCAGASATRCSAPTWLIMKTDGELQARAYPLRLDRRPRHAGPDRRRQPVDAVPQPAVHGALVRLAGDPLRRAGAAPGGGVRPRAVPRPAQAASEAAPFLAALALFVLCYVGLGISFYPYIVPPSLTIWEAAAPDSSLGFLLVGRRRSDPADPRLHRLVLLGVPRQGRHLRRATTDGRRYGAAAVDATAVVRRPVARRRGCRRARRIADPRRAAVMGRGGAVAPSHAAPVRLMLPPFRSW